MLALCYPRCTTCKRAMKWLEDKNIPYTYRDIAKENPTKEELVQWHELSGLDWKRFFNTSGLKYKELQLKDKLPGMTDDEKAELLATDGMLVKRPLIVGDGFVLVGFKEAEWQKLLG